MFTNDNQSIQFLLHVKDFCNFTIFSNNEYAYIFFT